MPLQAPNTSCLLFVSILPLTLVGLCQRPFLCVYVSPAGSTAENEMSEGEREGWSDPRKPGGGDGAVPAGAVRRLEKAQAHRAASHLSDFGTHCSSFASHSDPLDTHPRAL